MNSYIWLHEVSKYGGHRYDFAWRSEARGGSIYGHFLADITELRYWCEENLGEPTITRWTFQLYSSQGDPCLDLCTFRFFYNADAVAFRMIL